MPRLPSTLPAPISWETVAIAGNSMRFLFRLLSLFALSIAVILAVVDATRSIAISAITFTPLIDTWRANWPHTLRDVQNAVEMNTVPMLWDPVLVSIMALPGWLLFALLALALHALGRRRKRPGETYTITL